MNRNTGAEMVKVEGRGRLWCGRYLPPSGPESVEGCGRYLPPSGPDVAGL